MPGFYVKVGEIQGWEIRELKRIVQGKGFKLSVRELRALHLGVLS